MLNKIFLALLAVAVLVMAVLSFLTNSQLNSIGFSSPQIVATFRSYENIHWVALWISSLVLLILSNVIMWTNRKSWALWTTFAFFAVFIMVNTWWLTENLSAYQTANKLDTGGLLSKNGLYGAFFVVATGIGIFFNQFIVFRLRDKMFGQSTEPVATETVEEKVVEETVVEEAKAE